MKRLKNSIRSWLNDEPGPYALSDESIKQFLNSAEHREDPIWLEIELFLKELSKEHPLMCNRVKRDLKWLRKKAFKAEKSWGKK